MKKLLAILTALMLILFLGACSESTDGDEEINEFEMLSGHLESGSASSLQWVNSLSGWIVNYGDIKDNLSDYFILDIRSSEDFNNLGHLTDAVNSTMAGMFDAVASTTKPILVVCYSGQSASYAHTLLRLKGHEAYVLKFGMSIVDVKYDKWTANCNKYASVGDGSAWVTTASEKLPQFDYPTLSTGKKTAEEILDDRIDAAIAQWGECLTNAQNVADNLNNYNVITYWNLTDADVGGNPFTVLGHFDGAYQVPMKTMKTTQYLSALDPDGTNILYCWTGQTAAATISYLRVLGYDVKSVAFGVNSIIWDDLPAHKWPKPYGE